MKTLRRIIHLHANIMLILIIIAISHVRCGGQGASGERELAYFPCSSKEGVVDRDRVLFDPEVSSDEIPGSIRVQFDEPGKVCLFEVASEYPQGRYVSVARMRTERFNGEVSLSLNPSVGAAEHEKDYMTGTSGWTVLAPDLRMQDKVDRLYLVLIADGTGTVWLDDIQVTVNPDRPY